MNRTFGQLTFTPLIRKVQEQHGSREQYQRIETQGEDGSRLGQTEREFLAQRDSFCIASIGETGWPYVQSRSGLPGFLRVLDDQTLGFVDLRGNRQYISVGNLLHESRVALFLTDHAARTRMRILGHVVVHQGDSHAAELIARLRIPEDPAPVERAILIRIEAFEWACEKYITARYTEAEIGTTLSDLRERLQALERENAELRAALDSASPVTSAESV